MGGGGGQNSPLMHVPFWSKYVRMHFSVPTILSWRLPYLLINNVITSWSIIKKSNKQGLKDQFHHILIYIYKTYLE